MTKATVLWKSFMYFKKILSAIILCALVILLVAFFIAGSEFKDGGFSYSGTRATNKVVDFLE